MVVFPACENEAAHHQMVEHSFQSKDVGHQLFGWAGRLDCLARCRLTGFAGSSIRLRSLPSPFAAANVLLNCPRSNSVRSVIIHATVSTTLPGHAICWNPIWLIWDLAKQYANVVQREG
jgi:hypothetical protein